MDKHFDISQLFDLCSGLAFMFLPNIVSFYLFLSSAGSYIAVHHYGKNVSRLQEYLTQIHNDPTFSSRPIWLT